MNSSSRTILLASAALLLAAVAFREAGLAWLALPFLAYFGLGLLLAPTSEEISLEAERSCRSVERDGATAIEVVARLRNLGAKKVRVVIADPLMRGMSIVEGSLSTRAALAPGEAAELRYLFAATRGGFEWSRLVARVGDPFGLFEIERRPDARARFLAQPRYRKWRPFTPRLEQTLSSPGSIPIRLGGSGTDFWGIREYRQGDSLKRLYWRLNARDPFKRYTKEFIQERTAEIVIVLDGRQRMELEVDGDSLFEREVEAVASLAAMLIRQGQRVGLFVLGTSQRNIIPDYGRVQLRRILNCLAEVRPQSERSRESLRYLPVLRYSPSATLIVVSPFEADDASAFQRLRALGYRALLVSPDALGFARLRRDGDYIGSLSTSIHRVERRIGLDQVASLSFPVVEWDPRESLAPHLAEALSRLAPSRRSAEGKA